MNLENLINALKIYLGGNDRRRNGAPQAGVMVLFFEKDNEAHLLLTERATGLRKHSGQISFPGGKIESFDHTIEDTALRETHEEIGLRSEQITVLGKFNDFSTPYYPSVTPIIGTFDYPKNFRLQTEEIDQVLLVPLKDLLNPEIYHSEIWEYQGKDYLIHFYDWQGESGRFKIWGATGGVIHELLKILR